jgi:hypothetical protein
MMDKILADLALPGEDRHFQRVQGEIGSQVTGDLPADDRAGEQVGDERGIGETAGRAGIGDIGDPAAVRGGRGEVAAHQVSRLLPGRRGHRGPRLAAPAPGAFDAQLAHQPLHRAPGGGDALAAQLQPHLPRTIKTAPLITVVPHPHDLLFQPLIPDLAARRPLLPLLRRIISGDREFQDRAGRLDTEPALVRIDEPD